MTKAIRLLVAGLILCGLLVGVAPRVAAHVLKQDNGVSAVMHIAPFDDPAAGEPTKLEFEYGSTNRIFTLANYSIKLRLTNSGKLVTAEAIPPAFSGATSDSAAIVTFPASGVYKLQLIGTPTSSSVPAFQMSYDIRVARAVGSKAKGDATVPLLVGLTAIIIVGMIAGSQISRGRRYQSEEKVKGG